VLLSRLAERLARIRSPIIVDTIGAIRAWRWIIANGATILAIVLVFPDLDAVAIPVIVPAALVSPRGAGTGSNCHDAGGGDDGGFECL
jgi:hypothetical protein